MRNNYQSIFTELFNDVKTKLIPVIILVISLYGTASAQNCTVNAGVSQEVCVNNVLTLYGGVSGISVGPVTWTQTAGPTVIITDPNAAQTTVTGLTGNTSLTFRISAQCGDGSLVWDEVTHDILPISVANAGPDQSSCPGTDVITMSASTPGIGEISSWSFVGSNMGITINDPASPTTTLSLSETSYGTARLVWYHATVDCFSYDTVSITNCGGETPVLAERNGVNPINLSACYTTTQSYQANASFPGNPECGQLGTWNIISGPNIPTINSIHSRTATFSNLIEGTYTLEWEVSGPCVSGTDILTINVPEPVGATTSPYVGNATYCEGVTEIILTGTQPLYTGETVQWVQIQGPPCTIVSPNNPITAVTGLDGSSTYRFSYTILNSATLCSQTAYSTISYTAAPTLAIGPDQILDCGNSTAFVPYTSSGSGALAWQIISGPAGNIHYPSYPTSWYNAGASPSPVPFLEPSGDYVIIFRKLESVGSSCSAVFDDIIISTSTPPSNANAGSEQILACNVTSTQLVGNDPSVTGGGVANWYTVSKPSGAPDVIFDDPSLYNATISGLVNGLYTFRWIITGGPNCPTSQDDVNVLVALTTPTIADAGPDELICYGTPYQLQGNPTALNESGAWTVSPSAGITFSDVNNPNAWVYGMQSSTVYTFTWTITNACSSTSNDAIITTTSTEGPVEAEAGIDECYPSGTTTITLAANDPSPGTGQWFEVSSPAAFTFDDDTDPTTNINISADGTYELEWVTSFNGCTESRDTVVFTVSDPTSQAEAGSDQILCGSSTNLAATVPLIGTGVWEQVIGPPGIVIDDIYSATTLVSGFVDGIYAFTWTVSNGVCNETVDTVKISASTPQDVALAGPDQFLCGTNQTTMAANPIVNGTGYWTMIDGPNSPLFDEFNPTTTVTGMLMGIYTFRWTSANPPFCPESVDEMIIEVVPTASVTPSMEFCDTTSVQLNGNPNSNGYWEQVILGTEPIITVTSVGNSSAIAEDLLPGSGFTEYAFRYVIDYPGCTSADTTFITVYEAPSPAAAGLDQEHCNETTFTMNATIPASGIGSWSILSGPGSGSFVNSADPVSQFINAIPGTYIFLWSVENGACSNADPIRIDNYAPPTTADASVTPYDDYYCDSTLIMHGNLPAIGVGTWAQVSGPSIAQIVSPILPNTEVRNLQPGTYVFSWTITNGPICPPSVDLVTIVIAIRPSIPDAGPDQDLCYVPPLQTTMAANNISIGTGTWSQHSGPNTATIQTSGSNTSIISDLIAGDYEFVWTAATDSCNVSDTVTLIVYDEPTVADAGADSTFCISDPLILYGNNILIGTGTWSQVSGPTTAQFTNPSSPTTGVYSIAVGTYEFEWRTENGPCAYSADTVEINISALPSFADAGSDQYHCEQDSVRLTGNLATTGIGTWTQTAGPPCTIENPSLFNTDVLYLQYGTSKFRWTITNGACSDFDELEITRYQLPSTADAGPDQDHCSNIATTNLAGNLPSVGTGLWTQAPGGPGLANIVNPANPNTEINTLVPGTYNFIWTISTPGTCPDSWDTVAISINNCTPIIVGANGLPNVNGVISGLATCAETDLEICLEVTDPEGDPVDVTQVNVLTGSGATIIDPIPGDTCFTYQPASGYSGPDQLEVIVCDNGAIPVCDTVIINLTVSPETLAYAGADVEICESSAYTIADATASYYSDLLWTTSGDGLFSDAAILNPVYTPGANDILNGSVVLTLTAGGTGTCPDATDDMTIIITPASTVFAGADADICETSTYTVSDATASDYDNLLWSTSGTGTFDDPTLVNPTYTPSQNDIDDGFVILTISATNGPCSSSFDEMTLSITSEPSVYAGANASMCESDGSYIISDAIASDYASLQWTSSGDGSWDNPTILNPEYTPGPNDLLVGNVNLTLTAIANGTCANATSIMTLTFGSQPIAVAGPDDEMCETEITYTLSASTVTNATSILWTTDGTGTFNDPSIANPVYTPSASDIQDGQIELSITAFGDGICADASDFMILTIWQQAEVYAGADDVICAGEIFQPFDADAQFYIALLWSSSGDGNFSNTTVLHPIYTPGPNDITAGTVTLTLTAFSDGTCTDVSDDLTLTIDQAPTVFAGADAEICVSDGSYLILDATASNYTALLWTSSGTGSFNDPSILNPIYTPSQNDLDDGVVTLTLTAFASGTCDDATDDMVLTITPAPTSFAGADAEICESDISYLISDANATDYSSISWSTSGDGSFNNNSILNPEYTPGAADIAAGTVQLALTAFANGSCTDATDDMILTISPAPIAFAGADAEICESDGSYFIADASASNYAGLLWTTSGTGSFDDSSISNPIYTPSQNDIDDGFVTLTLTALSTGLCGDVSDNMVLTISPGPIAYAGADKDLCETEVSYTISDATASEYASLDWATSGDGFFVNPNILNATYVPSANDILNGSVQLSLTAVSNGLCADATDEMTLSFSLQPTAFAGADVAICETDGGYEILDANATNYSGLLWTTSGSGSFNDASILNPIYAPSQNDIDDGFVELTLTAFADGSCENAIDELVLTITSGSTAYAGADAEICETTGVYLIADALASDYASLLWTSSGDGIFNNNTILNPEYIPGTNDIANGTVQLTLTAFANGLCTDASDDMILTITKAPIVFAGPDNEICESEQSYELSLATAVNFSSILWISDGTGSFDDPNSINPVYTPSESDILDGQVRLSITAFGQGSCADASDEMLLTIWKLADAFAGMDASICSGESYQLWDANAIDYTSLLWTSNGDGIFSDPTELNPVYTPGSNDIINGLVALTLTVNSAGTCPDVSDDLTLTISEGAQAFAGPDDEICESDQNYTLSLATASNYSAILWTTDGSGSFDDPNSINAVYMPSASDILDGQVMLSITAYGDGNCSDVSDEMLLSIWKLADVFAGIDASICEGESYQLWDANAVDFTTLLWTTNGDGYFSDATALNPVYNPGFNDIINGSVLLTLTASSAGSCPNVSDDLTLSISEGAQAFAGVDNEICESSGSYFISDATASSYTTLLWTSSGSGSFDNPSSLNPIYTPSQNDIEDGYAVLTLTATGIGNCEDASDDMVLTITTEATAYAGADSEICETEGSYTISDAIASGYASLVWTTSGDGSFNNSGITNPVYTPGTEDISSGSVQLTLTAIANGMCSDASDMMILTISEAPIADAGNDAAICVSDGSYLISDASASNYSEILWTSSGSGSFNNPASIHPVYTPSQNDIDDGSVILTLTAYANGTCENAVDEMILTITSGPIAFAGADAEICETASSYFLSDATASDYAYLAWSSSGDGSFNNSGILNPEYTPGTGDMANGSAQLTLTAFANGSCTDAIDEMTLNISKAPQVFAGPDDEICESEPSYTLSLATGSDYTTLQWTTDGTGSFDDPNIINPIYTPSASDKLDGQVRLSVTAFSEGSCPNASDEMLLTIWKLADVFAGIDATICEGESYQLWDANAENYTGLLWTSNGDGYFSDATQMNPVYNPGENDIANGLVTLTLTANSAGTCPNVSDDLIVTISDGAQVFAGEDASVCETDIIVLSEATASNYSNLIWSSTGDGSFNDPTILNPVYTPGPIDKFVGGALLTLEAFGTGSCDDASDQVRITLFHPPVSDAGMDDEICAYDVFPLNGNAENYTIVSWSTSGDGNFDNFAILDPIYLPGSSDIAAGNVTLTLTVYGYGSCGSVADDMTLTLNSGPVANAGADQYIANYTATQLDGSGTGGSDNYIFDWEPKDLIINPSAPHPTTFTLSNDQYMFTLTLTDTESGCSDMDTVYVFTDHANNPPVANDDYDTTFVNIPITIDILTNDYDPDNDLLEISLCAPPENGLVVINSDGTIQYSPYNDFSGTDSLCYVICDSGTPSLCDSAMVYIFIADDTPEDILNIYTGFTPNSDGTNDKWTIDNIELFPDNNIIIFNRWGDHVNEFVGYNNSDVYWDGDNQYGERLPDGTYFYVLKIKYDGKESTFSGWIFMHGSE